MKRKKESLVNGQKTDTKPMKFEREGKCQKPPNLLRLQECRRSDSHKVSQVQRFKVILRRVRRQQGCDGPRRRTVIPPGQMGERARLKGDAERALLYPPESNSVLSKKLETAQTDMRNKRRDPGDQEK